MSALFTPLKLKDITLRNRIGVAPMCQYSSVDGVANDWHLVHLGSRAVGGAGLIISEATAVSAAGRISPGCAGIWNDAQVEALQPVTKFITQHGAVACVQLAHAGRKASSARPWDGGAQLSETEGGWPVIGPSDVAFDDIDADKKRLWKTPRQMTVADIAELQQQFVVAAERSLAAGYQMIEIHAAHGYLLHSFFSPLVNQRTDAYGGDLAGRARMLLETVEKVRAVWPENLPLAVRLSVTDWIDGGLTIEDNIQMAIWLKQRGVDIVDCSGGGAAPSARASIGNRTAEQVDLAGRLKAESNLSTMAVGCITEAKQAEAIISAKTADIVLLARQFLRDPYWPMHAAQELGVDVKTVIPVQNGFFVG